MTDIAMTKGKAVLKKWSAEPHQIQVHSKEEALALVVNAIETAERALEDSKKALMVLTLMDNDERQP